MKQNDQLNKMLTICTRVMTGQFFRHRHPDYIPQNVTFIFIL